MLQKRDDPAEALLERLEKASPEDIDLLDYRWLAQRFHEWKLCESPCAKRAQAILKSVASRFSGDELKIK